MRRSVQSGHLLIWFQSTESELCEPVGDFRGDPHPIFLKYFDKIFSFYKNPLFLFWKTPIVVLESSGSATVGILNNLQCFLQNKLPTFVSILIVNIAKLSSPSTPAW